MLVAFLGSFAERALWLPSPSPTGYWWPVFNAVSFQKQMEEQQSSST
jgi:hypothetical protein